MVDGLAAPLAVVLAPAGRWWVAEKRGRVIEVDPATGVVSDTAVLDLTDEVSTGGEQGLLGMALSPDGRRLFLSSTDPDGTSVIDEYPVEAGRPSRAGKRTVLRLEQPFANHNGGHITFGPDGFLYVGFGDGGSAGDPGGNGQNPDVLLGKLLRIDPVGSPYAIPADNPFARGGGAPEIWASGLRNPWRFSFDRATGDLWIGDVGQDEFEEIDLLPRTGGTGRGANLGWDAFEGTARYDADTAVPAGHVAPVYEYEHRDGGCSVTGGFVYRGRRLPALTGWYVFADYCVDRVEALAVRGPGDVEVRTVATVTGKVVSFAEDADGELLILTTDPGQILRLEPLNGGVFTLGPALGLSAVSPRDETWWSDGESPSVSDRWSWRSHGRWVLGHSLRVRQPAEDYPNDRLFDRQPQGPDPARTASPHLA